MSNLNNSTTAARAMINAWHTYAVALYNYMVSVKTPDTSLEHLQNVYNTWTSLTDLWKVYTDSIRAFGATTNWTHAVEVKYGDIIGFALPEVGNVVYQNAFTSRTDDENTAICRYAGDKLLMRVGGLPVGTYIFTPRQTYMIDESGVIFATPTVELS